MKFGQAALEICDRFLSDAAVLHKIRLGPVEEGPSRAALRRLHAIFLY